MIKHRFFTRKGGVSQGGFKSLNLTALHGDDADNVARNKQYVISEMAEGAPLAMLNQIHGAKCIDIDDTYFHPADADAFVTDHKKVILGILTADCAPVLFSAKTHAGKDIIGAAHAGWRGAHLGVCENTLDMMINKGAVLSTVQVFIGPCIARNSYEVDERFYQTITKDDEGAKGCFDAALNKGHYQFDLSGYIEMRLKRYGISNINIDGRDTYAKKDLFFSYRRATHEQEDECGRQISTIVSL